MQILFQQKNGGIGHRDTEARRMWLCRAIFPIIPKNELAWYFLIKKIIKENKTNLSARILRELCASVVKDLFKIT